jgi:hypothetical protein
MALTRGKLRTKRALLAKRALIARLAEEDAAFKILDLPPELVEHVFKYVQEEDASTLPQVRLVCRTFRDHSIRPFGSAFFKHVIAVLHPLSLTILLEIANHPQLSKFVQKVTINCASMEGVKYKPNQQDNQNLIELQKSMERSEMDRLILTEVFRKLPGLATVHLDNAELPTGLWHTKAVRCGSRHIYVDQKEIGGTLPTTGKERVFEVVFSCLRSAALAGRVSIGINASFRKQAVISLDAINDFCQKIDFVEVAGQVTSRGSLDLLQSAPNLSSFEVFWPNDICQFSHPDAGLFVWPKLTHFRAYFTKFHGDDLVNFFNAHKTTISSLELLMPDLITGSWKMLFDVIADMPKLEKMTLQSPVESTPPSARGTHRRYGVHDGNTFRLDSKYKIHVVLHALRHDFRTTKYEDHQGPNQGAMAFYVDLRLAQAVLNGRAVIQDGKCRLVI